MVYERIDVARNISVAQSAAQSINGTPAQIIAFFLIGCITIFLWFLQFYVDWKPSYHFGEWLVAAVGATGNIALFAAVVFTAVLNI